MKYLSVFCVLMAFISATLAESLVKVNLCSDADQNACSISEVRVTPCTDAARNKPCKLKRGSSAHIEFDFVPHFSSNSLKHKAYSAGIVDLPLVGMEEDGCKALTCPLVAEQKSSYKFDIYLSSLFPPAPYTVKWRVWDTTKTSQECCFTFKIKLT